MRVLVIESDAHLAEALAVRLVSAGAEVDVVADGTAGVERAFESSYQVVVLDKDCPGWTADWMWRDVSSFHNNPCVLMLAAGSSEDRVDCLDLGADDCLLKPFSTDELVARVRALARRNMRWISQAG